LEEEFDIRPYVEALLRNWKWIIGAGILAALIALGFSFLMPSTYEATALVAVSEPRQVVQFDPRIRTADDSQPFKAYPELATSDELLASLLDEIASIAPDVITLADVKSLLSAEAGSDPSLLHLSVKYGDPQVAADVANKWAELFVVRANEVFGGQGGEQLSYFEDQLSAAKQKMQQAEEKLIGFQARNRSMILDNELTALQQTQADQLARERQIALLLQDAEGLLKQLNGASNSDDPSAADQLAAVLLQLRAYGGVPSTDSSTSWQLQVNVDQISAAGRQEQITFLSDLQDALAAQTIQIDTHLAELEPQILRLQQEKQEADIREGRLSGELALAGETHIALANKVEEEKITSQNTGSGVRLASRSAVPEWASGPRKLLIITVGGFIGMFIAILVILVFTWWRA
jgi:uncharacterized protein involved in exopolysaccharide biosynthesis